MILGAGTHGQCSISSFISCCRQVCVCVLVNECMAISTSLVWSGKILWKFITNFGGSLSTLQLINTANKYFSQCSTSVATSASTSVAIILQEILQQITAINTSAQDCLGQNLHNSIYLRLLLLVGT